MLKRKAMDRLEFWRSHKTKQALLVTGARQVGKTYIIREFAQRSYKRFVEFNMIENTQARESFAQASNADDLAFRMTLASKEQMVPGETLIFIDEVQECIELVTMIKFLVDKGDYDYVLSGSMLGVELENVRSIPVGYLTQLVMFPLDFEEFCWANGMPEDALQSVQQAWTEKSPVHGFLHKRLLDIFHLYLLIGGMPDAVTAYLGSNSIEQVRIAQDDIMAFYEHDISKYAPKDRRLVIKNIFELIPSELSSQNRRFKLSSIDDVKRFKQVQDEFLWLVKANVALAVYNIKAPISPLLLNESHSILKLFYSDVGLLASTFPKQSLLGLLDGKPTMNLGATYESFVAQELTAHGFLARYFANKRIGEIDFMVEGKDGRIVALEVKSGMNYKSHAAISKALEVPEYEIAEAYVLAETNVEQVGGVVYVPIYMASCFLNE